MRVKGTPYKVKWEHNNKQDGMQPNTCCIVQDMSFAEPKVVAVGCAFVHPKDRFSRNIGRRVSMQKALWERTFKASKELRKMFWESYFEMRGKKW